MKRYSRQHQSAYMAATCYRDVIARRKCLQRQNLQPTRILQSLNTPGESGRRRLRSCVQIAIDIRPRAAL